MDNAYLNCNMALSKLESYVGVGKNNINDSEKSNFVDITMKFKTLEEASIVFVKIHELLTGLQDYKDSKVLLRSDNNTVNISVFEDASDIIKTGILGLDIFKALTKNDEE